MLRLAAAAALAFASHAHAALVTLDFETFPPPQGPGLRTANTTIEGFRFSPSCHFDALEPGGQRPGYQDSGWIGFDSSGCSSRYNTAFLGPATYDQTLKPGATAALWIDHFGSPFSLASVYINFQDIQLFTSKGGYYKAPRPIPPLGYPVVTFDSPLFEDVTWIMFLDVGVGAPVGIDHLTLQVPEPGSGALAAVALLALLAYCRAGAGVTRVDRASLDASRTVEAAT
jgi:hypothetical protein